MIPELRRAIKHRWETVLCGVGVTRLARARRSGQTIVLAYHNIVPEGDQPSGDLSLHLPQRAFAQQLELLVRTHEIIPLTKLQAAPTGSRPRAVITFDDAYSGALTAGLEELNKRSVPATVFVSPAFVGGGSFWWDVLASSERGALSTTLRNHALHALAGDDASVRAWAGSLNVPQRVVPRCQTVASEAELAAAAASGLILFGSHTWSHRNLTALATEEMKTEMWRPVEWLRERFSVTVPWISYPYGLRNAKVEQVAASLGFEGAFLIDGGWINAARITPRHALPRLNVPAGLSVRGFEIRTAGVLPS